jgi:hypothetical protein
MRRSLFSFPNPVNEVAARTVALGVVVMAGVAVGTRQLWLTIPIAYGFSARVLAGPRFSPLGLVATRVIAPRLRRWEKFVPGPPKRFAQAMGATLSLGALGLWVGGEPGASVVLLVVLVVPATLEAAFGYCVGCKIFGLLMRAGLIPTSACAACADISSRRADATRRRISPLQGITPNNS